MSEHRERHRSASPYEERFGFSRGIRVGNRIEVAGTGPIPQDGSPCPNEAYDQMRLCGEISIEALEALGASASDVIRTRMYITDATDAEDVGRAHRELFGGAAPVATMVVISGLADPAWKVEIEVEAAL